jgi:hypothetical protein
MENLICNFAGVTREEILEGRKHLVAPATLIVPGVLNGSLGPLYYPPEEVSADPEKWDNVPILVYHPKSAESPKVFNEQAVGHVHKTVFEDHSLKAELWFDADRVQKVDNRIYEALINNQKIELSTGLKTDNEKAENGAVFNTPLGKQIPYTHIARNHRPDHLAVFTDQVGACSLDDGCGVLNKLSDEDVRETLRGMLRETLNDNEIWVETLYTNEVIYSVSTGGLFRLKYTRSRDKVTLSSDAPVQVQRVTTFKVVNVLDSQSGSSDSTSNLEDANMATKKLTEKSKRQIVDELINNSCCWAEEDRSELESMTDNQLTRTKDMADKQIENEELLAVAQEGFGWDQGKGVFNAEKKEWEFTENKKKEEGKVDNQKPEQMTEEEWMAQAPDTVKNTLNHARESELRERKALIDQITTNVDKNAKPEGVSFLANKSVEELRQIASFMPKQAKNRERDYYGAQPREEAEVENIDREDMLPEFNVEDDADTVFAIQKKD